MPKHTATERVEQWPLERVTPYARNARKCPDHAVAQVAASIREFGFRNPILVDEDGTVIAGHTRLRAAERLGLTSVPVIVCRGLSKAQVKALRLADNRTAEYTAWDMELLPLELEELKELDFDLNLTGFAADEVRAIRREFDPVPDDEVRRLDERKRIACPACGHEFTP